MAEPSIETIKEQAIDSPARAGPQELSEKISLKAGCKPALQLFWPFCIRMAHNMLAKWRLWN